MSPDSVRALIDRIAASLGPDASPERVERVARAVLDANPAAAAHGAQPQRAAAGETRVVVTAYGLDVPGVLSAVTSELAGLGANILDVSQKVLQGYFTLVLFADLPAGLEVSALRDALATRAKDLSVRILVQHEELFQAMHRP
ncbi:MAG: ACT domain-containing protein [Bacteroidota bacterium]